MAEDVPSVETLVSKAKESFENQFNEKAEIVVCAPGRVNLIGEHTDYNDGFVFPMALPMVTVIVGKLSSSNQCTILTLADAVDEPRLVTFDIGHERLEPSPSLWSNYMKGVIANFPDKVQPFNAVVTSSVPLGGGLSSSASLEVATYTFIESLLGSKTNCLKEKALVCQKAEHEFANMPCGIMDQFISTMGVEGSALLIDCRSMESELIPLDDPSAVFVIINSNVKHTLSGSEYPSRRKNCHEAAKIMNSNSLRDVTSELLEAHKSKMTDEMYEQARHVITEIKRTIEAVDSLKEKNYDRFGQLMTQSHISLRDDFKVSCPELDQLVDYALEVEGVYGSRMTGGGFGGCTVTLISQSNVSSLINHVKSKYSGKPTFYVCKPSQGAQFL